MNRRELIKSAALTTAAMAVPRFTFGASDDLAPVFAEIVKRHDEGVRAPAGMDRAALDRRREPGHGGGVRADDARCCARPASSRSRRSRPTASPASSPRSTPARRGRVGALLHVRRQAGRSRRVVVAAVGRRARRQARLRQGADGPRRGEPEGAEAAFLAALHAIRGAGRKLPVNLVLVAEGEEEIGSPHFQQIVRRPEVIAALRSAARASSCPRRRRTRTAP